MAKKNRQKESAILVEINQADILIKLHILMEVDLFFPSCI